MSAPIGIKDAMFLKANSLANNIASLINALPKDEIYELKVRLMHCVSALPDFLLKGFKTDRRIDKIRSFIYASSQLEECKGYLTIVENMKYADVTDLKKQIDEMSVMLRMNTGILN